MTTSPYVSRLAMGTAQLGLNYGVANTRGQLSKSEAAEVLTEAARHGIRTLDTATLYGESECRLGQIGVQDWQVVSKLSSLPPGCSDTGAWVLRELQDSLARLKVDKLYGLLLHRPSELLGAQGPALYAALKELQGEKMVQKIGISIYSPDELPLLMERYSFDLVQAPMSVFDRRLIQSGWLDRLVGLGVEVHARSVFLQGLLLMSERPAQFARWASLWRCWDQWLEQTKETPLAVCLQFVLSYPQISRVVVGVDSSDQLREIITAVQKTSSEWPENVWTEDTSLLHPSLWPQT